MVMRLMMMSLKRKVVTNSDPVWTSAESFPGSCSHRLVRLTDGHTGVGPPGVPKKNTV